MIIFPYLQVNLKKREFDDRVFVIFSLFHVYVDNIDGSESDLSSSVMITFELVGRVIEV